MPSRASQPASPLSAPWPADALLAAYERARDKDGLNLRELWDTRWARELARWQLARKADEVLARVQAKAHLDEIIASGRWTSDPATQARIEVGQARPHEALARLRGDGVDLLS